MFSSFFKKHRGTIGSLLIPFLGAVVFKIFDTDGPKSFTSVFRLLKGVIIEEFHQEVFQLLLDWVGNALLF